MDEPFAAFDAQTRLMLQRELSKLSAEMNLTVMFITHSVEEAVLLGDRVVVMTARPGYGAVWTPARSDGAGI